MLNIKFHWQLDGYMDLRVCVCVCVLFKWNGSEVSWGLQIINIGVYHSPSVCSSICMIIICVSMKIIAFVS